MPREKRLTFKLSGIKKINGLFDTWVKKNSVIGEELSKTISCSTVLEAFNTSLSMGIYAYDGDGNIDWGRDESGNLLPNFRRVCLLQADLSGLERFLKVKKTSEGQDFWRVSYKVKILFGGTALKARLAWYEGVRISHFHPHVSDVWLCHQKILREGPVSIIPDSVY